jgi:hypothetical protein
MNAACRRVCKTPGCGCKTSEKSAGISATSVGNGVTVAQQTLTLFVLVRIQVPQPDSSTFEMCPSYGPRWLSSNGGLRLRLHSALRALPN